MNFKNLLEICTTFFSESGPFYYLGFSGGYLCIWFFTEREPFYYLGFSSGYLYDFFTEIASTFKGGYYLDSLKRTSAESGI